MKSILLVSFGLLLNPIVGKAQYSVTWSTLDNGGGTCAGAGYVLSGTIGQSDAGAPMSGGVFSIAGGFWPGVTGTGPIPSLRIFLASPAMPPNINARVTLAWPFPSAGFRLEAASTPVGGQWAPISDSPSVVDGEYRLTLDATGLARVFRLHSP